MKDANSHDDMNEIYDQYQKEELKISFDAEYQLKEYRELEPNFFYQKDGIWYTYNGTIFSSDMALLMLNTINLLEKEIIRLQLLTR